MVDYSNIPRDSRRVPLETRVQFKFDRFFGFLSEYSANISPGGMFITTRQPQPPGTVLDLEFSLGDGFELIKGRGEVIWARQDNQGNGRPAGMGIQFLELSDGSKELIYRMVDNYIQEGGVPFDLSLMPDERESAAAPPAVPVTAPDVLPAIDSEAFDLSADPFQLEDLEPPTLPGGGEARWPTAQEALVFPEADSPVFPEVEEQAPPEPPARVIAPAIAPPPAAPEPVPEPPVAPPVEREELQSASWTSAPVPLEPETDRWSGPSREPEPPVYLPEPPPPREGPTPLAHYAGSARATEPRRSAVPWLVMLLVSVAALTGFVLMHEQIMDWAGLGDDETIAAAPPTLPLPRTRTREAAPGGPTPSEATPAGPADGTPAPPVITEEAPETSPEPQTSAAAVPPPPAAPVSGPPATAIQRITFERLPTGTEVVLWGNGAILPNAYTRLRIDGATPREVIKLTGIRQPFPSPSVGIGTAEVQQVRVGLHPGNELHVVLDLTGPKVQAAGFQEDGNRLRVLIQRQ